ncbi:MAG: methylenetetrahydrofolate reductase [NAD(P)H] [Rhodospirillaceae bacterium]|nr:MAG: methylenetetrahydrofolate reductase [NAD(P)H] [Rhodospirillaceae bacterium]
MMVRVSNFPRVSFEFFPPKTPPMAEQLWATIRALEPLHPQFVSVTYGAGGTTRDTTFSTVRRIAEETSMHPAAHLTCIGHSRGEIDDLLRQYWDAGIRHIVALRGDPPPGESYRPHPDGYAYAADLIAGIKRIADFEVSAAAFPESHPQAQSSDADLENLKRKFDAGADRAITQYFFNNHVFLTFLDRARRAGIDNAVVPGILPVTGYAQVVKFSKMCGASVPSWLHDLFDGLDDDPETRKLVAAMVATEQCRALMADGIDQFHFYTLNRADLIIGICRRMGLKPAPAPGIRASLSSGTPPMQRDPQMPD